MRRAVRQAGNRSAEHRREGRSESSPEPERGAERKGVRRGVKQATVLQGLPKIVIIRWTTCRRGNTSRPSKMREDGP